jgi:AcrR family transcriptional regulator
MQETISYVKFLEKKSSRKDKSRRKGERTKDRLVSVAARVLEEKGYRGLTISEITERSKVSPGAFYIYFKNKSDIAETVLSGFLNFTRSYLLEDGPRSSAYEAILGANLKSIKLFSGNQGLLRCLMQFSDEDASFARLWQENNFQWYSRVAESVRRRSRSSKRDKLHALFEAYVLGGMVEQFLRDLYVMNDRSIAHIRSAVADDDIGLAEELSRLWYRALYLEEPPSVLVNEK